MTSRILTPSNQITILRLVFVPVFAILVMEQRYRAALAILAATGISDVLDGMLARRLKQESPLGVALDPIADKILMTTAYLTLSLRAVLPWWLTVIVLTRDLGILLTALLIVLVAGYRPFYPSLLGKASTAVQMATIFLAVAHHARISAMTGGVLTIFIYLTGAVTMASAVHYLVVVRQRHGRREADDPAAPGHP
jgi:cardiolipin synthase (CMP-forming)